MGGTIEEREERFSFNDALREAGFRLSPPIARIEVSSSLRVMEDMTSIMRKKLKPHGLKKRKEVAAEEGVDLFGLVGAFWNTSQAQLPNGNPRGVGLSVTEIIYIANLFEPDDITTQEVSSLIAFRGIAGKALDRAQRSQE